MQKHGVTHLALVPPIVLALAKHPLVDKYNLLTIKFINSGAAPLDDGIQRQCAQWIGCIVANPAIADAAIIGSPDEEAGEVPKAFKVARSPIMPDEIMIYVAERVAPHEKIRRVELVDQIPKSASGKILRRLLIDRERAAMKQ